MYFFIVLTLWTVLQPIHTSLFSGSEWRNSQTYAALPCFREAKGINDFAKCYFAPPLGYDDKHYIGLEQPVLPLLDYLLGSQVDIYSVQSKVQLFSLILIIVSMLVFFRFTIFSLTVTALYGIALFDNPTFNFFALSYQPDLLSMGLIFAGATLAILDKTSRSYIPEVLAGIGIMVKPQHGAIAFMMIMSFRYINMRQNGISYLRLFIRAVLTTLPTVFFVVSNFVAMKMHIGVAYPGLNTSIGGMSLFPRDLIIEIFKQMFPRNGYEYLRITLLIYITAVLITMYRRKGYISVLLLAVIAAGAYVFTYVVFVIGFIANIYYGSILFITLNLLMIYLLHSFSKAEEDKPFILPKNWVKILIAVLIIGVAVKVLHRPQEHFSILLRDRHKMCDPRYVRAFADALPGDNIYLNNRTLEPTIRTALGRGSNLWYLNLGAFRDIKVKEIKSGEDFYYFSCSYFNELLNSDEKAKQFIDKYADVLFINGEWTVWKLK